MKIHRFIDNFDLNKKELKISGEIARQMINVLKLKIGEKVELCDGESICVLAEIINIEDKSVMATLLRFTSEAEQNEIKKVCLFCSIFKKENFELVVQKATECGASKIIPVISARTIKTGLNIARLQKIAKEASEQSGRINVPEISDPVSFEKSLEFTDKKDLNILFNRSGEFLIKETWEYNGANSRNFSTEKYPCSLINNSPWVNLFIGPEGGWTGEEIKKARKAGFQISSLGPLTLRGETAAIVATYLVSNLK